jgi:hypothetical protein
VAERSHLSWRRAVGEAKIVREAQGADGGVEGEMRWAEAGRDVQPVAKLILLSKKKAKN